MKNHNRMKPVKLTDSQKLQWILQNCELFALDVNGAKVGGEIMNHDDLNKAILRDFNDAQLRHSYQR